MKKVLLVSLLTLVITLTGCLTQATATEQYVQDEVEEKEVLSDIEETDTEGESFVNKEEEDLDSEIIDNEVETEEPKEVETKSSKNNGVAIDAKNFPDINFRKYVKDNYDKDADNFLSQSEIDAVISVSCNFSEVKTFEGIKIFKNLIVFNCCGNDIEELDCSGMQNLRNVMYAPNNGVKTIDFRNCPNLKEGFHSVYDEVVYISAGMTNYIGCIPTPGHSGNIVIDLDGYYTTNADGSKAVDLTKVISPELIDVLSKEDNPEFDKSTNILTIPAGEGKVEVTAGKNWDDDSFTWTFYTNINAVDDVVVTFNTNGGSIVEAATISKGSAVAQPKAPTKDGYDFAGWYTDKECTVEYDFATVVNSDLTLYAKWTAKTPVEPTQPETPAQEEGEVLGVTEAPKVVKTADNTHITLYMMVLFLAGSVAIKTVSYKKKENKE